MFALFILLVIYVRYAIKEEPLPEAALAQLKAFDFCIFSSISMLTSSNVSVAKI